MSLIEILLLFLVILFSYFITVYMLHRKGVLDRHNLSLWGPALMWRTERGKKLIDRIARYRRFWKVFGLVGIISVFVMMGLMLTLLISVTPLALEAEETIASTNPEIIIGLPGLNPIIPLWFGIIGLIVTLVVHEFSHGILSRAGKLKVKSLGLLFFIIPIGAFCEPDEKELKKTSHLNRMRVFAAGPMANIVMSVVCIGLISMLMVTSVEPAAEGVGVITVGENTPAADINMQPGMIITSVNNTRVTTISDFQEALNVTQANQTISIQYVYHGQNLENTVTLSDKYIMYNQSLQLSNTSVLHQFKGKGYLGVATSTRYQLDLEILRNPFSYFPEGLLYYIGMPLVGFINGYNPITEPFTTFYTTNTPLPTTWFWAIINILYWIFWIDFMAATFNVLPMIPLDGGYILKDTLDSALKRFKTSMKKEKREHLVSNITTVISFLVLFLILAPIIIPYIRALF